MLFCQARGYVRAGKCHDQLSSETQLEHWEDILKKRVNSQETSEERAVTIAHSLTDSANI